MCHFLNIGEKIEIQIGHSLKGHKRVRYQIQIECSFEQFNVAYMHKIVLNNFSSNMFRQMRETAIVRRGFDSTNDCYFTRSTLCAVCLESSSFLLVFDCHLYFSGHLYLHSHQLWSTSSSSFCVDPPSQELLLGISLSILVVLYIVLHTITVRQISGLLGMCFIEF